MDSFKFTERQNKVLKALREQTYSEKELHLMYQGAIMVKDFHDNPESVYQAAHSLRELTRYITVHIKASGNEAHKKQMKKFLENLDERGGIINQAIINQWYDLHGFFVNLCHHRIEDLNIEEFEEKLNQLENIILAIHGPVYDSIGDLDTLINIENPTMGDLEKALSLIKYISPYEYFIKNLKHPNWLDLLDEKGIFENTPQLGKSCVEPLYLLKIAGERPDKVLKIIMRHSETDHIGARVKYLKCLTQMSSEHINKMKKTIGKWIISFDSYYPSFYYTLKDLVLKLIEIDAEKEIFYILPRMFAIKEEILIHDKELRKKRDEYIRQQLEIEDSYENLYQQDFNERYKEEQEAYIYEGLISEIFPNLIKKYPSKTFKLFKTKLLVVIRLSLDVLDKTQIDDSSLIWRRFIEGDSIEKNFLNVLVNTLRNSIDFIGNTATELFPDIIEELSQINHLIFKRLKYHALVKFPELNKEFISNIEFNKDIFKDIDYNYELFQLIETSFNILPKKTRKNFLDFILEGAEAQREFWKSKIPSISEEMIYNYVKAWQKRKLKPIVNYIDDDFLKNLSISKEEIENVTLFEKEVVVFGDKSPISKMELGAKSIKDLTSYLISYENKKEFGFSKIGLARQIRDHVPERPLEFLELLKIVLTQSSLHKYISFIIDGLNKSALEEKPSFIGDLFPIFEIILKKLDINEEPILLKEDTKRDINKSIADFINDNLRANIIPIKARDQIWEYIKLLIDEKDISKEEELKNIEGNWTPQYMHLNSVFGVTLEAIFAYISWISNNQQSESDLKKEIKLTTEFPEVIEVLESLLESPLYTTLYILGFHLNDLCYLDHNWISKNIEAILPLEKSKLEYFEATWAGYLDYNSIPKPCLKLLRFRYLYSLDQINDEPKLLQYSIERLVNHISLFYILGLERLEEENSLVTIFLEKADGIYRKIFIREIGVNLNRYEEEPDFHSIKNRLKSLLKYRLEKALSGDIEEYTEELKGFFFWFRNSIFDREWMINQFLEILKLLKTSEYMLIYDDLRDYALDFPLQTVSCLKILSEGDIRRGYLTFEQKIKSILEDVLKTNNLEAKQVAQDYIDHLLKLGYHTFKDLI